MSDILKMFTTVIKSLFKKSTCRQYPFKKPVFFDRTKGHIQIDRERCILCSLCDKRCPTGAINVDRNARTWAINSYKCILCFRCVEVCPVTCLAMQQQYSAPEEIKKSEVVEIPAKAEKAKA